MHNCEGLDDEFELFRAQSYGVESVLRHQRAASVRASSKVISRADDFDNRTKVTPGDPEITPQPRSAAERKASFKSSARRRIYKQRIPEEVIVSDEQTTSGQCENKDGGDGVMRQFAADDSQLARQKHDDSDVIDDVTTTSADFCRVYRMRSFYTKSGNIVNRGDSMRTRTRTSGGGSARRTRDVIFTGSSIPGSRDQTPTTKQSEERPTATNSDSDNTASRDRTRDYLKIGGHISTSGQRTNNTSESTDDVAASAYRVLLLGSQGVGKTTLTEQLMTSEYLANKESFAGSKFQSNITTFGYTFRIPEYHT